jgi:GTPase Era involved in 16S rRNA processing
MNAPGNDLIRDFMDKLTATTNVSKYVELPMIAVMGDTSSGKSSLLSSISMVELPSHSKLTTRCPIVLRMCKSISKYATVGVQWKQNAEDHCASDYPQKNITEDEWENLPCIIAEAQDFIIKCTKKEVARDCVIVNVFSPDCHDLTLIDLPGIVRSRGENEGATIVQDIKSLINDYLANSRCVILAVVPANIDFHNSEIMASAKEVDPETRRTIPVITKPDLVDKGGEMDVLELLRGEKIQFDLGFHMVKGRGQAELDKKMTIEEGLSIECSFFENTQPWRNHEDRDMFGIANLRGKLGELQMQMIKDTMPEIIKDMTEKLHFAERELLSMGSVLGTATERMLYFRAQIHLFVSELTACLRGSTKGEKKISASAQFHKVAASFHDNVGKGRLANITRYTVGDNVIVTTKDGDRPCVVKEIDVSTKQVACSDPKGTYDIDLVRKDPKWLIEILADRRTQTLPCFLNEEVFQSLAKQFVEEDWIPHIDELMQSSLSIINKAIDQSLTEGDIGKRYKPFPLMVERRAKVVLQKIYDRERSRLNTYLSDEMAPYTQNRNLFDELSQNRNKRLQAELSVAFQALPPSGSPESVRSVDVLSMLALVFSRFHNKSLDNHMADEMEAVLDSYGKVAMTRVIDVVPMCCLSMFRDTPDAIRVEFDTITDKELLGIMYDGHVFLQQRNKMELLKSEMEKGLALFASLL